MNSTCFQTELARMRLFCAAIVSIIPILLLIPENHHESTATPGETINHLASKLFPCLLLPLFTILHYISHLLPIFHRSLTNIVLLILQIVQLILLAVAFITVLWTAQAGKDAVMMRAPEFVLAFLIAHQIGLCAGLSLSQVGKCVLFGESKKVMILYYHYRQVSLEKLHN